MMCLHLDKMFNCIISTSLHEQYNHPDGKSRRVLPSWKLPKISSFQAIYQHWHCGDEANNKYRQ